MRAHVAFLLTLGVLLGAPHVMAEEASTPAAAVLEALPAAAAEHAWEFRGYVLRDGRPYGRVTLSAGPHSEGAGHWLARDEIVPLKPQDFAVLQTARLDGRLQAVSGHFKRRNTKGWLHADFVAAADGYQLEHESDYYENRLDLTCKRGIATLAGVVTFLRHAPAAKAVYTLDEFDPDPSGGDPYAMQARIQVHGRAGWRVGGGEREAWIVSFTRGKQTLRLAFDEATRALLGVDYVGTGLQFVPEGSGTVGLADPDSAALATPLERAVRRTAAVRSSLPLPTRPFSFLGDVRLGDTAVGTVMLSAEPARENGIHGWRVLESQTLRVGEAVIESETSGFLGRDLRVLRGERIDKRPEGTFHVTYTRERGGIKTVMHTKDGPQPPVLLGASESVMTGLVPALLFLREVPANAGHYVLPGWDPRYAQKPKAGTGTFTLSRSDLHVEVSEGRFERFGRPAGTGKPVLLARCGRRDGWSFEVALRRDNRVPLGVFRDKQRTLLGVRGSMPRLDYVRATPGGAAERPDWYDAVDGVPKTWRQAFVKFGRGYHRPRRDLLADAFHWPSMVKAAFEDERYEPGTPEAQIRKDWIDVFVGMSKHRTKGDSDDLLLQIFMTGEEWTNKDGSVSLRTLPAYGGHTYRMQEIDGRWFVVRID